MVEDIRISIGLCSTILTENLGIWHVSTEFVPCILITEQDTNQQNICTDALQKAEVDVNFIKLITAGDET
jgi:hypothetical protein